MSVELLPKCDTCGARGCKTEHISTRKFTTNKELYREKEFHKYLNTSDEYLKAAENVIDAEPLIHLSEDEQTRPHKCPRLDQIDNDPQD